MVFTVDYRQRKINPRIIRLSRLFVWVRDPRVRSTCQKSETEKKPRFLHGYEIQVLDPRVRSLRLRRSLVFCGGHGVAPILPILPIGPKRTAAEGLIFRGT